MTPTRLLLAACFTAVTALTARADPPSTLPTAPPPPPDKSTYTLFNPVPTDQLREMQTDRPNVTNTPTTIDAGHLQIETGLIDYALTRTRAGGANVRTDDTTFGQFNFRLGVLNSLELNLVTDAYQIARTHDYRADTSIQLAGYSDTVAGAKLNLWGDESNEAVWSTAFAVQPQFSFPTATAGLGAGRFQFDVYFPFTMNLPKDFHLSAQPGVSYLRNTHNDGYVTGFDGAISLDRVLFANIDFYVEYASVVTTESHVKAQQTLDTGAIWQATDDLSFDTGAFFGLNDQTPDFEITAGISVRF